MRKENVLDILAGGCLLGCLAAAIAFGIGGGSAKADEPRAPSIGGSEATHDSEGLAAYHPRASSPAAQAQKASELQVRVPVTGKGSPMDVERPRPEGTESRGMGKAPRVDIERTGATGSLQASGSFAPPEDRGSSSAKASPPADDLLAGGFFGGTGVQRAASHDVAAGSEPSGIGPVQKAASAKKLDFGSAVWTPAAPGSTPSQGQTASVAKTESQSLFDEHTATVKANLVKLLDSGALSPEAELATRDGLDAFLAARANGSQSGVSRPLLQYELPKGTNALEADLEMQGKSVESDTLETDPQGIYTTGALICFIGNQLLLEGRFSITVNFQDLNGIVGVAQTCKMTNNAGYFFFFSYTNLEIPIKMLDACFGGNPPTHWVFAAGLTNFGVQITIFDLATGISKTYTSPTGSNFQSIIDQQTPFPCP